MKLANAKSGKSFNLLYIFSQINFICWTMFQIVLNALKPFSTWVWFSVKSNYGIIMFSVNVKIRSVYWQNLFMPNFCFSVIHWFFRANYFVFIVWIEMFRPVYILKYSVYNCYNIKSQKFRKKMTALCVLKLFYIDSEHVVRTLTFRR